MLGRVSPVSQRDTAWRVTEHRWARSSWVHPRWVRSTARISLVSMGSPRGHCTMSHKARQATVGCGTGCILGVQAPIHAGGPARERAHRKHCDAPFSAGNREVSGWKRGLPLSEVPVPGGGGRLPGRSPPGPATLRPCPGRRGSCRASGRRPHRWRRRGRSRWS